MLQLQAQHLPLFGRQRVDLRAQQRDEFGAFGGQHRPRIGRGEVGQFLRRAARLVPVRIAHDVRQQAGEPRLQPPRRVERVGAFDRQHERLLQRVLGGGRVAAQVQRHRQ